MTDWIERTHVCLRKHADFRQLPQNEVFRCYLVTQCFLPRVQRFQTFTLVHRRIAVQSINMNFRSGSRECTFSTQIWAEIGHVPPKQVFRHYLASYCSQTTLGHIRSICVASRWIGLWSFELNLQRESRNCAIAAENGADIRPLPQKVAFC